MSHPTGPVDFLDAEPQGFPNTEAILFLPRNQIYVVSLFKDAGTRIPAPVIPPS